MNTDLNSLIRQYWKGNLILSGDNGIIDKHISGKNKKTLTEVGIPDMEFLSVHIFTDPLEYEHLIYQNRLYHIIGDNAGAAICIEEGKDEIYWIDEWDSVPFRYMNANLEQLIGFVTLYIIEVARKEDLSDQEAEEAASRLSHLYTHFDPQALANVENWWSIVLEQLIG